jgi:hypothetical protein
MPTHPEGSPKLNRSISWLDYLEVVILELNMISDFVKLSHFMSQYRFPGPENDIMMLIIENKSYRKQNIFVVSDESSDVVSCIHEFVIDKQFEAMRHDLCIKIVQQQSI